MKILIAAAGTGGHINPAIAIAKYCVEQDKSTKVLFVGTEKGLENRLVTSAGFDLLHIKIRGIKRKITFENIIAIKELIFSYRRVKQIIREFKPDIVIGTGGYICGPVLSTSIRLNIPTIIHESNAIPGVTTKLLSRKLDAIAIGFEETRSHLKNLNNVINTGTPVIFNKNFIGMTKNAAKQKLEINDEIPLLLIYGGSQGATSINNAVIEMIKNHAKSIKFNIIFATGNNSYDSVMKRLQGVVKSNIKVLPYIYNMDQLMAAADLAVTRAGAMTCNEVAVYGLPSIMIPFPYAAENHQEFNARALEGAGAAQVILDKDLNGDVLYDKVISIINNKNILSQMTLKAKILRVDDADKNIYKIIERLVKNQVN